MTFHDRLEFWGVEIAPGKRVDVAFDDGDEELVHITQARARARQCNSARGRPFWPLQWLCGVPSGAPSAARRSVTAARCA